MPEMHSYKGLRKREQLHNAVRCQLVESGDRLRTKDTLWTRSFHWIISDPSHLHVKGKRIGVIDLVLLLHGCFEQCKA
jgi:hypothetical protein